MLFCAQSTTKTDKNGAKRQQKLNKGEKKIQNWISCARKWYVVWRTMKKRSRKWQQQQQSESYGWTDGKVFVHLAHVSTATIYN